MPRHPPTALSSLTKAVLVNAAKRTLGTFVPYFFRLIWFSILKRLLTSVKTAYNMRSMLFFQLPHD